jgi:hypothetical protein
MTSEGLGVMPNHSTNQPDNAATSTADATYGDVEPGKLGEEGREWA